jgi:hypothetical protein
MGVFVEDPPAWERLLECEGFPADLKPYCPQNDVALNDVVPKPFRSQPNRNDSRQKFESTCRGH